MKRKLYTLLTAILITILSTSTVSAGGLKLSGASTSLGSLIFKGYLSGLGNTNWVVVQNSQGHAMVLCTNYGGNAAPGQNYPHTNGVGQTSLPGNDPLRKNGKSPFSVESASYYETHPTLLDPVVDGGCPNYNWTASVIFIFWDSTTIYAFDPSVYDPTNADPATIDYSKAAATFNFKCVTTLNHAIPTSFTDGTVSCTQQ